MIATAEQKTAALARHYAGMLAYAKSRLQAADAADAAQDAAVSFLTSDYDADLPAENYLIRIVSRKVVDATRRNARYRVSLDAVESQGCDDWQPVDDLYIAPDAAACREESAAEMMAAVAAEIHECEQRDARHGQLLRAVLVEGDQDRGELAEKCGVKRGSLATFRMRHVRRIRQRLAAAGIDRNSLSIE